MRCPREHCGGSIVRDGEDSVCLSCGRDPTVVLVTPVDVEEAEMPRGVRGSGDGYKKLVPVLQERREEIQGPTVDALSHFEQAARRVIKLHQDWEQAKAREKEIREALMAAERILAEARSRLDAGLLAITTGSRPSRKGIKLGPRRKAEQVEAPADILTA